MAIPIEREPKEFLFAPLECCCFCHQPTSFWTTLNSRGPGQQVACCPGCAGIFEPEVVPSKDEWWDYHTALIDAREGR